jgi:hypothetical protein
MASFANAVLAALMVALAPSSSPGRTGPQADAPLRDPNRPVAVFVLDMAGDGFQFTSAADGVMFDMNGTGSPVRSGWTKAESDDGFLFLDTNGNGRVDSGRELLGNGWRRPDGSRVASGDDTLTVIQGLLHRIPGGVPPERQHYAYLDARDDAFARLRYWRDANHNGRSELTELLTLSQVGIVRILVSFVMPPRIRDAGGNITTIEGVFYLIDFTNVFVGVDNEGAEAPRRMVEVEFVHDRASR